ncbi:hypothetical protein ACXYTJ_05935 [Gilvimarinus sp. F26214L]|uniref:hypothetical protein n=1 Tax=Gilvimarinus sp. DZF01 TaxID=3461371 RepID=UPI004045C62B
MNLPEKIVALHRQLEAAGLPHAFGGALALAWCTLRARGTIDIDINIFVDSEQYESVLSALPDAIESSDKQRRELVQEGQVRLWWEQTPVDVFLNTTDFHQEAARRVRWEQFMGCSVPFLSCGDLAVLKAFFNRTQDWADLEAMSAAGTLNVNKVSAVLIHYLGADDERIEKLQTLR